MPELATRCFEWIVWCYFPSCFDGYSFGNVQIKMQHVALHIPHIINTDTPCLTQYVDLSDSFISDLPLKTQLAAQMAGTMKMVIYPRGRRNGCMTSTKRGMQILNLFQDQAPPHFHYVNNTVSIDDKNYLVMTHWVKWH